VSSPIEIATSANIIGHLFAHQLSGIISSLLECREEEDPADIHGHITSLAVLRTHRKLGLATMLMTASRECHASARQP
jgi:ribosomal protein S18 acetylase RimI-like enzyme